MHRKSNKPTYLNGYANVINVDEPNKLLVHLPIKVGGITLFMNTGDYNVWETDYNTYTVVYSCKPWKFGFKQETAWIMSRTKSLDANLINRIKNDLKVAGVNTDEFIKVDQTCSN